MADYVHVFFSLTLIKQIVRIPYGHQFSSPASIPHLRMRQVHGLSCDSTRTPFQTACEVHRLYFRELCQKNKFKLNDGIHLSLSAFARGHENAGLNQSFNCRYVANLLG